MTIIIFYLLIVDIFLSINCILYIHRWSPQIIIIIIVYSKECHFGINKKVHKHSHTHCATAAAARKYNLPIKIRNKQTARVVSVEIKDPLNWRLGITLSLSPIHPFRSEATFCKSETGCCTQQCGTTCVYHTGQNSTCVRRPIRGRERERPTAKAEHAHTLLLLLLPSDNVPYVSLTIYWTFFAKLSRSTFNTRAGIFHPGFSLARCDEIFRLSQPLYCAREENLILLLFFCTSNMSPKIQF